MPDRISNVFQTSQATIKGRWILQGNLRLLSPLIIGGGNGFFEDSDIVVLKDENGNPFIPSSSITGALKHAFAEYRYTGNHPRYEMNKLWFWGGDYRTKDGNEATMQTCQSALNISDMICQGFGYDALAIRDGIKIDPQTGIVENRKKFDYEIIESGACFEFHLEVVIREAFDLDIFQSIFQWIVYKLCEGNFSFGARTGQGFGRCRLEDVYCYKFDYSKKQHIIGWLNRNYECAKANLDSHSLQDFVYDRRLFRMDADFILQKSLMIGAYPGSPEEPDKVSLQTKMNDGSGAEVAVIPGSSWRGAIRSRAERIAKTLGVYCEKDFNDLFGWVDDAPSLAGTESKKAVRGRISVEESQLKRGSYDEEIQYRIRIDRFTGGVMDTGTFDSLVLWSRQNDRTIVRLKLLIKDFKDWEAGLMLLVLKDLWNEDLAVGGEKGIGRGILQGLKATIRLDRSVINLEQKENGELSVYRTKTGEWDETAAKELEDLIAEFCNRQVGREAEEFVTG